MPEKPYAGYGRSCKEHAAHQGTASGHVSGSARKRTPRDDGLEEVDLRLREEGQVYFGKARVVPSDETNITQKVEDALKRARDLDWRIHDLALMPVRELPEKVGRPAKEKRTR